MIKIESVSEDTLFLDIITLKGANLCGADMRCKRIYDADLNGVKFDKYTKWPHLFNPVEEGCIFVEI